MIILNDDDHKQRKWWQTSKLVENVYRVVSLTPRNTAHKNPVHECPSIVRKQNGLDDGSIRHVVSHTKHHDKTTNWTGINWLITDHKIHHTTSPQKSALKKTFNGSDQATNTNSRPQNKSRSKTKSNSDDEQLITADHSTNHQSPRSADDQRVPPSNESSLSLGRCEDMWNSANSSGTASWQKGQMTSSTEKPAAWFSMGPGSAWA